MAYQISLVLDPDVELADYIVRPGDDSFHETLKELATANEFGFDLETYGLLDEKHGLDAYLGSIRLMNIGLRSGKVLQLDLGGREGTKGDNPEELRLAYAVLFPQLRNPKTRIVGHNLKFDSLFMLHKFGVRCRGIRDTQIMSQVLWAGIKQFRHRLDVVAQRALGSNVDKTEQKSDWSWHLTNNQRNYGAIDALIVLPLKDALAKRLREAGLLESARIECDAVAAFTEMEFNGMPVDVPALTALVDRYESVAAKILEPFTKAFPHINPNSNKQLLPALEKRYGIKLAGTAQEHLAILWDKPEIRALTVSRTFEMHLDYAKNVLKRLRDGAVRTDFRQIGPKGFGRSTSSKPNLQNPPRPFFPKELTHYELPSIRSVFKAPAGYKLIIADLSQAHARIACEASQDPKLLQIYNQDLDTHCITGAAMANVQGKGPEWTAENIGAWKADKRHPNHVEAALLRQLAKPTFYGSLNAQSAPTLKKTAKKDANIDMELDLAEKAIEAWRIQYNGLYRYMLGQMWQANRSGDISIGNMHYAPLKGLSGRRIFLPRWPSKRGGTSVKLADACSFTWSSTEADAIKWAMGEQGILKQLDEHPEWGATLVNFMHDEVDLLAPIEHAETVANMVNDMMEKGMKRYIKSIPVNEKGACGAKMLADDWSEK